MKLQVLLLSSILAVSAALGQEQPAVVQFNDLIPQIDSMKGKEIAVRGGVDLVSASRGMFTISALSDAGCGDSCTKAAIVASLPENLRSQLPKPKDEVVAFGKLEQSGRGYLLTVTKLAVGPEQIKALVLQ
jgi:hypothetical protein